MQKGMYFYSINMRAALTSDIVMSCGQDGQANDTNRSRLWCWLDFVGKLCIEVKPTDKIAFISEFLCIGCGICVKKWVCTSLKDFFGGDIRTPSRCPFEAIAIINLPTNLESQVTHRYTANAFKLHRLPTPRPGQVLGLVGTNGIGKSTALKILAGKLKPNLGRYDVSMRSYVDKISLSMTHGDRRIHLIGKKFWNTFADQSCKITSQKCSRTTWKH